MKPFELDKALAGYPVVTRDGRNVNQLTLFKFKDHDYLYGVIEGSNDLAAWNPYPHGADKHIIFDVNEIDLFMAPKKVKRWIWINRNPVFGDTFNSLVCDTKENLQKRLSKSDIEIKENHGQIIEIEVDE